MKTEIKRRTFEAAKYPKGSKERNRLNEDLLTSEYMVSQKYTLFVFHPETETHLAYVSKFSYRTRSECEEKQLEFTSK